MRVALYLLLAAVALAAAVLSFAALEALALLCGFSPGLAPLLPVVVDAGAAGGSLVWLTGWAPTHAREFARWLALVLLGLSISANGLGHVLAQAGGPAPAWVVAVASGVAPAVLAALIHLGVLCGRVSEHASEHVSEHADPAPYQQEPDSAPADVPLDVPPAPAVALHVAGPSDRAAELIAAGAGRRVLARELGIKEHEARKLLDAHGEATG